MPAARIVVSLTHSARLLSLVVVPLVLYSTSALSQAQRDEQAVARRAQIDWATAARDAQALSPQIGAPSLRRTLPDEHTARAGRLLESYTVKEGTLPLADLNSATGQLYTGADTVPVPVLAPVDTGRFVSRRLGADRGQGDTPASFLSEAISSMEFLPGKSGYDAILTVSPKLLGELGIPAALQPQLHLAGTALIYGSSETGELVADLQSQYPGLRRTLGAEEVTYTFQRYGVPYFINIDCSNGPPAPDSLTCAQAEAIMRVVLRDLQLLGGGPLAGTPLRTRAAAVAVQPTAISPDFKYFAPGNLMSGTSENNRGGSPSRVVYGNDLLFPIKEAPAFANSQVYMHWGDCGGQRHNLPPQPGDQFDRYKCLQNPTKELFEFEGHPENYSYPWRDNLCEARGGGGGPPECPVTRQGHAGQDIRPQRCDPDPANPAICKIDLFDVVAVTAGRAWWKTGQFENHLRLMYDDPSNRFYYMYLHMSPDALRAAGMIRGQTVAVTAGQTIGKVGNFDRAVPHGTTAHLHFEIRRGDNIGDPLSPYMTLVRAYERLINALGTELP
jgi:hypothetical protein